MDKLLVVKRTHPSLDGHFPGDPIVPAVVILDLVIQHIEAELPPQRVVGVRRAKWLRPLRPDEKFELELDAPNNDVVRFRCRLQGELMAEGSLLLQRICQRQEGK